MVVSMCAINHWQIQRKVQNQLLVFQQSLHRSGEQNIILLILQERKKLQKTALSGNLQIISNVEEMCSVVVHVNQVICNFEC